MSDKEKVEQGIKACWSEYFFHKCCNCPYMQDRNDGKCVERLGADALALLKKQDERYVSMVISWLHEIAINNVDSNREMTFLDAVEDILDRASYGLKQYFVDKQEGR